MRNYHHQPQGLVRRAVLLILLFFVCVACAGTDADADESEAATSENAQAAAAPVEATALATVVPQSPMLPTATTEPIVLPTATPVANAEETAAALVVPTPASDKNQPVFRQARVDGDQRSAPAEVDLQSGSANVVGEVSAFTDRVDTFVVRTDSEAQELGINWTCTEYAAEDGRPVRMLVEQDGQVLSELRCSDAGLAGSTRVPIASNAGLVVVVDSNPAEGQTSANLFAAYEISLRTFVSDEEETATESPTPATTPAEDEPPASEPIPTGIVEPTVTPAPEPTPTSAPDPTPTPEPTPTPGIVTNPAPEEEEPPAGDGRTAPEDGDSRANPQRPEDAGFLVGSVSAPNGDRADWSAFTVGPSDPTEIFAGVLCDNFAGTGTLTVTIYEGTDAKVSLTCSPGSFEDFAELTLSTGSTYFIEAAFSGTGYTDWFFQVGDDD